MRGVRGHVWWGSEGGAMEAHLGRTGPSTGPPAGAGGRPPVPSHHVCIASPLPVLDCFDFVFVVLFSLRLKIITIITYWLYLFRIPTLLLTISLFLKTI